MRIAVYDNWCQEALDILFKANNIRTIEGHGFYKEDPLNTGESDGIIGTLNHKYTAKALSNYPNLKFIASCTTGLDHIDLDYCKSKGIDIISLKGETEFLKDVHATSEMTWTLIMALIRKVPFAHSHVIEGGWDRERFQGVELHGKTLGIIGYGRIGKMVERYAEAFGMKAITFDVKESDATSMIYRQFQSGASPQKAYEIVLRHVLQASDIVSVHLPLTSETKGMFSKEQFSMMKPTSFFINTSRGAIVDEEALIWALENKIIAGAALDVVQNEPKPWARLLHYASKHDNCIISPHCGGNTAESRKSTQLFIANRIKDYIEWNELQNIILKELEMTCDFCPSQWDGLSVEEEGLYIRFRHGDLSVKTNREEAYYKRINEKELASGHDGEMTTEEMLKYTGIKLTEDCKVTEVET